jgi:hypothetical protein
VSRALSLSTRAARQASGAATLSSAAPAEHLGKFTKGLSEVLKPFVFGAMPLVMQRHLVRIQQDAAYIAACGTAGNLGHVYERAASPTTSQLRPGDSAQDPP